MPRSLSLLRRLPVRSGLCLVPACLAASAPRAGAQTTFGFGPQVGVVQATGLYRSEPAAFTFGTRSGFEAGGRLNVGRGHWAVQPGVRYAQRGFVLHYAAQTPNPYGAGDATARSRLAYRLHYVTVPLAIAYTQKANGRGAQVFAGGSVGRLVGGHMDYASSYARPGFRTEESGRRDVQPRPAFANDGQEHFRPWDAGLQAGVGYRCQDVVGQVGYSAGLVNAGASNGVGICYRNDGLFASLTYLFGDDNTGAPRPK